MSRLELAGESVGSVRDRSYVDAAGMAVAASDAELDAWLRSVCLDPATWFALTHSGRAIVSAAVRWESHA